MKYWANGSVGRNLLPNKLEEEECNISGENRSISLDGNKVPKSNQRIKRRDRLVKIPCFLNLSALQFHFLTTKRNRESWKQPTQ